MPGNFGAGAFGGLAAPDKGSGGALSALTEGLTSDRRLYEQQQQALMQQQIRQTAMAYLQQLRGQLAANPSAASDPTMEKNVQQAYSQAGFGKAPMTAGSPAVAPTPGTPGTPATPAGVAPLGQGYFGPGEAATPGTPATPGREAVPAGIDTQKLGGVFPNFQEYITKYKADIEATPPAMAGSPSQRRSMAEQLMGRPLTENEAQALDNFNYVPTKQTVDMMNHLNTDITNQQKTAMKQGNAAALTGFVTFNWDKMKQLQYTDEQIRSLIQPGIDQLSEEDLAKITKMRASAGKDAEATKYMKDMAQARLDDLNAKIAGEKEATKVRSANYDRITQMLPAELARTRAQTEHLNADVKRIDAAADEDRARTSFIHSQLDSAIPGSIAAQKSYSAGIASIDKVIVSDNAQVSAISGHIGTLKASMVGMVASEKAAINNVINDYNNQINTILQEKQQYTDLKAQMFHQAYPGVNSPFPSGQGAPFGQGGGVTGTTPGTGAAANAAPPNAKWGSYNGQYGWFDPGDPNQIFHPMQQ
jgi:hypothetical protein